MDFGSIKNVGLSAINSIVEERKKNGTYDSFTSFCERIKDEAVNKKCLESLIKAGAFDELGKNRATLLASFETIVDTISSYNKKGMEDQVSMFDLLGASEEIQETQKYTFEEKEEMDKKDLLSMEKEVLGIYISGHPLEKYKEQIEKNTNINTLDLLQINNDLQEFGKTTNYKDGQNIKFIGIINKVKKKFTKKNTIMAFITIEDMLGTAEVIAFDSCYSKYSSSIIEQNIVFIEGRLSIREDEEPKIVASVIADIDNYETKATNTENNQNKIKTLNIDITNLIEEQKDKLRGAIKFFSGEMANVRLQITDNGIKKPCGAILLTDKIFSKFESIVGKENISLN